MNFNTFTGVKSTLSVKRGLIAVSALLLMTGGVTGFLNQVIVDSTVNTEVEDPAVNVIDGVNFDGLSGGDQKVQTLSIQNNVDTAATVKLNLTSSEDVSTQLVRHIGESTSEDYNVSCTENQTVNPDNISQNLEPGSKICVSEGTREEKIVIDDGNVTLVSENLHEAKIDATGFENGIVVNASNVTIKGFNITSDEGTISGITVNTGTESDSKAYSNIHVEDNHIAGMEEPGVRIGPVLDMLNNTKASKAFSMAEEELKERDITDRSINPTRYLGLMEEMVGASYGVRVRGMKPAEGLVVEGNTISDIGQPVITLGGGLDPVDGVNLTKYIDSFSPSTGIGIAVQSVNGSDSSNSIRGNTITNLKGGVKPNEEFVYNLRERIVEEAKQRDVTEEQLRSYELDKIEDSEWQDLLGEIEQRTDRDLENVPVGDFLSFIEDNLREENIRMQDFRIGSSAVVVGVPAEKSSATDPVEQSLNITENSFSSSDYGVILANYNDVEVSQNGFEQTNIDIVEANILQDTEIQAEDNWFGTNSFQFYGDVENNEESWNSVSNVTLQPGEERKIGVITEVPITAGEGDYNVSVEVQPDDPRGDSE